jgi:hypothetical protein
MLRLLYFITLFLASLCWMSAKMEQKAYIWQRVWDARVKASVLENTKNIDGLTVLFAEFHPADGLDYFQADIDYNALKLRALPAVLALRLNLAPEYNVSRSFNSGFKIWVSKAIETARENGVDPVALEIDFDCPTSQLDAYSEELRDLRKYLGGVPLSITTLPTWMQRPDAFRQLVEATDHFVLQAHSIKRPETFDDAVALCEREQSLKWTKQAASFGVPFHVALPTYAYRLAFDSEGKLVEVSGENASLMQNPDWRYRVIRSGPKLMAALVQSIEAHAYPNCEGIIWYRLPIGKERYNWDNLTWHAVMDGTIDDPDWQTFAVPQEDGAVEIQIELKTPTASKPPMEVRLTWAEGTALAWDGQRNYQVLTNTDHGLTWKWSSETLMPELSTQTRWTIGWVRFDRKAKLQITTFQSDD